MPFVVDDRVEESSTSVGTGAFTVAGNTTSFRTFASQMAVGDTTWYLISAVDASGNPTGEWETGLGTYSAANTLTRTTVFESSNANAAVNFSAGTKRVAMVQPAIALRRSVVVMTATQSTTAAAVANVTELVAALEANATYRVTAFLVFQAAAITTGLTAGFTVPTNATPFIDIYVPIVSNAHASGLTQVSPAAAGTNAYSATGSGVTATGSNHTARMFGIVRTGNTAGSFQVQFASEVALSAVTLQIGSILIVERIF